jgi:triacylglycerol lipase
MSTRPAVVLVHGIFDTQRDMRTWKRLLEEQGYATYSITFQPGDGRAPIVELARQLDAFVRASVLEGSRFHLIGHSMGGLVMRCFAQRYQSAREICGFVTLASPHHGSLWAWTQPTPGGRDMRPGSALLKDLANNDHRLERLEPLSLWTPFDLMILPSHSSVWPVARNERVWLPAHPQLKYSRTLIRRVLIYLRDRERPAA